MKLPNWFRIAWWFVLLGVLSFLLYKRYPDIVMGKSTLLDVCALAFWAALMLVPVFHEINLLGFRFKQQMESLKTDIKAQMLDLRADIRTNIRTDIAPQITISPPSDSQLPDIERRVRDVVREEFERFGSPASIPKPEDMKVDNDLQFLFSARYSIEKEMRRLHESWTGVGRVPTGNIFRDFRESDAFSQDLLMAIRDVYAVCSAAIHGEPITPPQLAFVRDIAPSLIARLRETPNMGAQYSPGVGIYARRGNG